MIIFIAKLDTKLELPTTQCTQFSQTPLSLPCAKNNPFPTPTWANLIQRINKKITQKYVAEKGHSFVQVANSSPYMYKSFAKSISREMIQKKLSASTTLDHGFVQIYSPLAYTNTTINFRDIGSKTARRDSSVDLAYLSDSH